MSDKRSNCHKILETELLIDYHNFVRKCMVLKFFMVLYKVFSFLRRYSKLNLELGCERYEL